MRYVSCRDQQGGVAEESACAYLTKPPASEVCSIVACGQWKVLEWTAVNKIYLFFCLSYYNLLKLKFVSFAPLASPNRITKIMIVFKYFITF